MYEFLTDNNTVVPSVTAQKMKEIDKMAVSETGPNLYQMMENAGRNIAIISRRFVKRIKKRNPVVLVMAGTGGNGGGGICAARHLANHGMDLLVSVTDTDRLKGVTEYQLSVMKNSGAALFNFSEVDNLKTPDLIIDSVLGYSLNGVPEGRALDFIYWMNDQPVPVLSLDVPSGIDATSGEAPGEFVKPDVTLTLALPKTGLKYCTTGKLFLGDIGIPSKTFIEAGINYQPPFSGSYVIDLKRSKESSRF